MRRVAPTPPLLLLLLIFVSARSTFSADGRDTCPANINRHCDNGGTCFRTTKYAFPGASAWCDLHWPVHSGQSCFRVLWHNVSQWETAETECGGLSVVGGDNAQLVGKELVTADLRKKLQQLMNYSFVNETLRPYFWTSNCTTDSEKPCYLLKPPNYKAELVNLVNFNNGSILPLCVVTEQEQESAVTGDGQCLCKHGGGFVGDTCNATQEFFDHGEQLVCRNSSIFSCKLGSRLRIDYAAYGRNASDGKSCFNDSVTDQPCNYEASTLAIVRRMCEGKFRCDIGNVTDEKVRKVQFGNPCEENKEAILRVRSHCVNATHFVCDPTANLFESTTPNGATNGNKLCWKLLERMDGGGGRAGSYTWWSALDKCRSIGGELAFVSDGLSVHRLLNSADLLDATQKLFPPAGSSPSYYSSSAFNVWIGHVGTDPYLADTEEEVDPDECWYLRVDGVNITTVRESKLRCIAKDDYYTLCQLTPSDGQTRSCPLNATEYYLDETNKTLTCYLLLTEKVNFNEAEAACRNIGGHLAAYYDKKNHTQLHSYLSGVNLHGGYSSRRAGVMGVDFGFWLGGQGEDARGTNGNYVPCLRARLQVNTFEVYSSDIPCDFSKEMPTGLCVVPPIIGTGEDDPSDYDDQPVNVAHHPVTHNPTLPKIVEVIPAAERHQHSSSNVTNSTASAATTPTPSAHSLHSHNSNHTNTSYSPPVVDERPTTTTVTPSTTTTVTTTTTSATKPPPPTTTTQAVKLDCERQVYRHRSGTEMTFQTTKAGETAESVCPGKDAKTVATWLCDGSKGKKFVESGPDLSKCVALPSLEQMQELLDGKSPTEGANVLLEQIGGSKGEGGLMGGDLSVVIDSVNDLALRIADQLNDDMKPEERHEVLQNASNSLASVFDQLLGDQKDAWEDIPEGERANVSTSLLKSTDDMGFSVANLLNNQSIEVNKPNLELRFSNQHAALYSTESLNFTNGGNDVNLPSGFTNISGVVNENGTVKSVFAKYANLSTLLPASTYQGRENVSHRLSVSSEVLGATVGSPNVTVSFGDNGNVTVTFKNQRDASEGKTPICAFWNISQGGFWDDAGCSVDNATTNATHTVCLCNHLTNFAVLMDLHEVILDQVHGLILTWITILGCSISIICLTLSCIVFITFRSLWTLKNTMIHCNLSACLVVAQLVLLVGLERTEDRVGCAVVAGLMHFFWLAAFVWMALEGVQLYVLLIKVFDTGEQKTWLYYLAGYGIPAFIVIVSASAKSEGYGTATHCWLSVEDGVIYAFAAPMAVIFVFNMVILTMALRAAASIKLQQHVTKLESARLWIRRAASLVPLLGLTWVFGFLYVDANSLVFAYLFAICNSLQGVFIFVFHCVRNEKVQQAVSRFIYRNREKFDSSFGTSKQSRSDSCTGGSSSAPARTMSTSDEPSHHHSTTTVSTIVSTTTTSIVVQNGGGSAAKLHSNSSLADVDDYSVPASNGVRSKPKVTAAAIQKLPWNRMKTSPMVVVAPVENGVSPTTTTPKGSPLTQNLPWNKPKGSPKGSGGSSNSSSSPKGSPASNDSFGGRGGGTRRKAVLSPKWRYKFDLAAATNNGSGRGGRSSMGLSSNPSSIMVDDPITAPGVVMFRTRTTSEVSV